MKNQLSDLTNLLNPKQSSKLGAVSTRHSSYKSYSSNNLGKVSQQHVSKEKYFTPSLDLNPIVVLKLLYQSHNCRERSEKYS